MPYVRVSDVKMVGQAERLRHYTAAAHILADESRAFSTIKAYDVFLSHAYDDAEVILGVKRTMESLGVSVYVDWIEDAGLDRTRVTSKAAALLRARMRASASLVYVHSPKASDSVWMPWELGYFDGFRPEFVWVLPLVMEYDSEFKGQEYLGLYPKVEKIASLVGHLNLGFANVKSDERRVDIALADAIRSRTGVFLSTSL